MTKPCSGLWVVLALVAGSGCGPDAMGEHDAGVVDAASFDGGSSTPDGSVPPDAGSFFGDAGPLFVDDGGHPLPPLETPVVDVPARAVVHGLVRAADDTGRPLEGARVAIGDATGTTNAAGIFAIEAATGHTVVRIEAAGFVTYLRDDGVVDRDDFREIWMAPAAAPQSITTTGGAITSTLGSVTFPAGAFGATTQVSATFIDDVRLIPGDVVFRSAAGTSAIVHGVVAVETPVEPAVPATVSFALPPGADATRLSLYRLDDRGQWVDPIAPESVDATHITFSVPSFSDRGLIEDVPGGALAIRSVSGDVLCGFDGDTPLACHTRRQTASILQMRLNRGRVEVQDANGTYVMRGQGTSMTLAPPASASDTTQASSECMTQPCASGVRYSGTPSPTRYPKFMLRSRAVASGVRGTVANIELDECGDAAAGLRTGVTASVFAGSLELAVDGRAAAVASGTRTTACAGCTSAIEPACCWGEVVRDGCLPGTTCPVNVMGSIACDNDATYEYGCGLGATCGSPDCGCSCSDATGVQDECTDAPECLMLADCMSFPDAALDPISIEPSCTSLADCPRPFQGCFGGSVCSMTPTPATPPATGGGFGSVP